MFCDLGIKLLKGVKLFPNDFRLKCASVPKSPTRCAPAMASTTRTLAGPGVQVLKSDAPADALATDHNCSTLQSLITHFVKK